MKKSLRFSATLACFFFASCGETPKSPDPAVEAKLEEMVSLWERTLERESALEKEERKVHDFGTAIALSEARLALATERRDSAKIREEWERIVDIRKKEHETAVLLFELGQLDSSSLTESHAKWIEAQIGLLRSGE